MMDSIADILTRYSEAPERLEAALAGLSEAELDLAGADGGWTIRQIVHHIADGDDLWAMCIKAALGSNGRTYSHHWYSTDNAWAQSLDYAGRAIAPAIELLDANRRHVVQLVQHLPDAWERYVLFNPPSGGDSKKVTVRDIVSMQARHAWHHIDEIGAIRQFHRR